MKSLHQLLIFLRKNKVYVSFFLIAGIIVDIHYFTLFSDVFFFSLLILIIGLIIGRCLATRDILILIVILLFMFFFYYILDTQTSHTERSVTWFFFLLIINIGQQLWSMKSKK